MRYFYHSAESAPEVFPDSVEDAQEIVFAAAAHELKTKAQREYLKHINSVVRVAIAADKAGEKPIDELSFETEESAFIIDSFEKLAEYRGDHPSLVEHSATAQDIVNNVSRFGDIPTAVAQHSSEAGFVRAA